MLSTRLGILLGAALVAGMATGCTTDLGECDPDAAREVVFRSDDGTPAYAGQALVISYCVGCHSPGAQGAARAGAPAELDFDLTPGDATLLRRQRRIVFDHRHAIASTVKSGTMPPKNLDDARVTYLVGPTPESEPLPEIGSREARDILFNWLACDAPIVGAHERAGEGRQPGDLCSTTPEVGDCRISAGEAATATWSSLYSQVLQACLTCHSPERPLWAGVLDMSTSEIAYASLMGEDGTGGVRPQGDPDCVASDWVLVEPGDPEASLLIEKIHADQERREADCGIPMIGISDPDNLDLLREWIENGALND